MKTLKVALFSAVLFSGLAQAHSSSLEVVKAYMAAWNAHDASKAATLLSSDVVYYDAAAGEPVKGRDNAEKEVIAGSLSAKTAVSGQVARLPTTPSNLKA